MIDAARLVAKQHRFELTLAAVLSLAGTIAAMYVAVRLADVAVPTECIQSWRLPPESAAHCTRYLEAFGEIYYSDGAKVLGSMAVLPFVVGLLVGVPVVSRELESGTAQFAWSIAPSRMAWLLRQLLVVTVLVLIVVGSAATASEALETTRRASMASAPFDNVGLHGLVVAARALAALAVGLLIGALTGRSLPAFVVGAVLMSGLLIMSGTARDAWAWLQPQVVVEQADASTFDGQTVGLAWLDRTGRLIPYSDAHTVVPTSNHGGPDEWLMANGYEQVQLGITPMTARPWEYLEAAGWMGVAFACLCLSVLLVARRRPG